VDERTRLRRRYRVDPPVAVGFVALSIATILLGPVDVSFTAALEPVFIRGKAGGEMFGYSK